MVALIYDGVVADNRLARMEFCNETVEDINIDNVMRKMKIVKSVRTSKEGKKNRVRCREKFIR